MTNASQALLQDQYNAALVSNVCPPDWVNPQPKGCYDLVVIGGGPAGLLAVEQAARRGATVALIEERLLGGESLNTGSVPSKCLIRSARAYHDVYKACRFGIQLCQDIQESFPAVMSRLRQVRNRLSLQESARRLRNMGVDVYFGRGTFSGPRNIIVGGMRLRFARALIATGSRPIVPPIEGIERVGYLTHETVFSLTQQPRRLAVIGAGPAGCELAQAFCRLGSDVTLIEQDNQILPDADADAARVLAGALQRDDVSLCLGAVVSHVRSVDADKVVHIRKDGESMSIAVDEILVTTGRAPNIEGLNLAAAGVRYDVLRGVIVDKTLRTSNRRVYAAGDVCTHYRVAHAAGAMAQIAVENALWFGRRQFSGMAVPSCTYTEPEVAQVGLNCERAALRGIDMETYSVPMHTVDRAIIDGEETGLVKIHTYKGTDRIAGATIVASHAGEMVGEIALAMVHEIGLGRIAEVIRPYPTQSEAIRKAAELCNRARPAPLVRRLLDRVLEWTRR
jgi:pyruvate/2-oxoglutarate dehydrogenase complex dihydrolipoamide dehydrogenase (E3) component